MPLDASAVRCTAYEINNVLQGGKIEKIYQPERDEVVLFVKTFKGNFRLVISANSANPRIYITKTAKENPTEPPMFCMLMRKHITSGRILEIKSVDFERIAEIVIESRNEMGDMVRKYLICEIMGKNSNIILTDENRRIIDSVKHVDLSVSRVRNIFPGLTYHLPPDSDRINPLDATEEDFFEIIEKSYDGKSIDKALTGSIAGISPLMAREAAHAVMGRCDVLMGELTGAEKEQIANKLYEMFQKVKNNEFESVVLYKNGEKKPMDFAVYPINQYGEGYETKKMEGICHAMEEFYSQRDAAERMRSRSYALLKTVTSQLDKTRKKITLLEDTLKDCLEKEKYRIAGDIITANLYRMNQGDEELIAVNYYDENGGEIKIKLDVAASPSQNAQQYYKKYRKAKTAEIEAAKQIEKALEEAEYLESVVNEIEFAKTPSELDEIRQELLETGVIKNTFTGKKQIRRKVSLKPVEYFYEGYTIFSGKNNMQNDYLTLKMGRANDLWLHVKNLPGCHVLIKNQGEDFPLNVIEAACIIAATNSKGATGSKVDVDYCPVSHVRKPNGAKVGMVVYEGYSTATVIPDEDFCNLVRVEKI